MPTHLVSKPLAGLTDYHMHTTLCGHASGSMDEYIRRAIDLGLDEIGFSEHIFLYHLRPEQRDPELAMAEEQMPVYVDMVRRAQEQYPEVTIRLGLEADYISGEEDALAKILAQYPWDYVYGSVHFVDGWGLDDPRYIDGYSKWQIEDLYEEYFGLVCAAAATHFFDVMAHLDLVKKFGFRPQTDLRGVYDRVARSLAASGVCIEGSSGGMRVPAGEMYPHPDLLRACYQAGVPTTLGSDSHKPEHVGYALAEVASNLTQAGYRQYVRFDRRKRSLYPLPEASK